MDTDVSTLRRAERAAHVTLSTLVVGVLVPVLLWPAVASLVWWLGSPSPVSVFVYDQTVADASYVEHASLGLALEYEKVAFRTDDTYLGAAPGGEPHGEWPASTPDLVMLVDAYGVYLDAEGNVHEEGTNRVTERLEATDAERVAGWVEDGSVLYGEFNILSEPTSPGASETLQHLFGVRRTGWAGRPFEELAEVPDRLQALAGGSWEWTGPGIVLVSDGPSPARLLVLDEAMLAGTDLSVDGRLPESDREVTSEMTGWFEIVAAETTATVDLWFRLPVNELGRRRLDAHGVPERAPLVVRQGRSLYLAADASENHVDFPLRRMAGSPALLAVLPQNVEARFFYRLYLPIVQWLVGQAETRSGSGASG